MQFGIGIDVSSRLSFAEEGELVREAADAGYTSAWTPSGPAGHDGFQACTQFHGAMADRGGITTGIAVIPAPLWTVQSLAHLSGSLANLTGGRFILGIGTGGIYSSEFRESNGVPAYPAVAMMRDYLVVLRRLLAGETVTYSGKVLNLRGVQVTGKALPVPLYTAALGPQMLRLAGETADGICLNWATPAQRAWARERLAEGAAKAGRNVAEVKVMEYIRVCIDDDEDAARRAFVRAFMGYALSRAGASPEHGYRGHMSRMGFDETLKAIEARRDAGAKEGELVEMFPEDLLRQMGYYGKASGAPAALGALSEGLDEAVIRIVGVRPGMAAAQAIVQACSPKLIGEV